ncbi:hypothetical protein [Iodobacter fluviatilis]|uniref:Uncharacterized protein n=1 Tax=Iodobacter fluviatilis TaxID=537 RepID=A0A377Q911_9NEIS|nr:hypothetical protein [Iodobacter fluviatilis]TCU88731.1 hypothetical protein EV682_103315 [Iodobacter fluviatilis]STQ91198.1 Uncharacterised protein [Iodobacter fluviatilis]
MGQRMSDTRAKEQSQPTDRPEQNADQVKSKEQEKIALWIASAKKHPWLATMFLFFALIGLYALLSGKAFDLGVLINGVVIFIAYRCIVAFMTKQRTDGVTRNDKK